MGANYVSSPTASTAGFRTPSTMSVPCPAPQTSWARMVAGRRHDRYTCGTLAKAAAIVKEHSAGGHRCCYARHLERRGITTLNDNGQSQIVVTNNVPPSGKIHRCEKLRVIDMSPRLPRLSGVCTTERA
ncbi:hypothetical protein GGR53DRAFT_513637 [Hypoxylon sp. FL1150]|nr:hypothetical protein GGR53DRAFT_513637 [Hypoxylon sp. FL1150]